MVMRDPFILSLKLKSDPIIYVNAYSGIDGEEKCQEFANYQKECFILAVGVKAYKYPSLAAKLAGETAAWGYKVIRTRMSREGTSSDLMKRIFRSVNLRLWQKHKEAELTDLVVVSLGIVILSGKMFKVGTAGEVMVYLCRNFECIQLNTPDINFQGNVEKAAGMQKPALVPKFCQNKLESGETVIMLSGGTISESGKIKLAQILKSKNGESETELMRAAQEMVKFLKLNEREGEVSLVLVHKRLDF